MTSKFILIIYVAFIGLGMIPPAFAGEKKQVDPKTIPNAEDLIKHCWDISEEKRSTPNTAIMRAGNLDTALCLRKQINFHGSILIDETSLTEKTIETLIGNIHDAYGRLYWILFNENKGCNPSCGTENYIRHNWETAKLYEKILTDIISLRKKYGV